MIDAAFAQRFAADWIAAWNRHDLDAILAHYLPQAKEES
jgi:ketosteroid isomerase-like protein